MSDPILIVDDDPIQLRLLQSVVERAGHEAIMANGGQAALSMLSGPRGDEVALVILDLTMPDLDGLAVLQNMRDNGNRLPVIVQTAREGIDTVINAMRIGAFDYFVKPADPVRLQTSIVNALKVEALEGAARRSVETSSERLTFDDLVMLSPAMLNVVRLGRKAATSSIPIMVEGESGVGKEVVARAIQGTSERRNRPFVTVNCSAIPELLVESILFGHEKGAFSGASERHVGKFVEAHRGTLFLDEVGDLPLDVQGKLLRAVQSGEIEPVGARQPTKVDIRIISSTHRNLVDLVRAGRFREDLYYRLNVFPIIVPPLRGRREGIPHLVEHFMARFTAEEGRGHIKGVTPDAMAILDAYDWPGNVRQLENAVFRAVVLCEGEVLTADDFPQIRAQTHGIDMDGALERAGQPVSRPIAAPAMTGKDMDSGEAPAQNAETHLDGTRLSGQFGLLRSLDMRGNIRTLASVEEEMIRFAIAHYNGQMSEIARRLGIGRSTLYRKLKEYGIDVETSL
ncbi:MAG: sigma-54-dependent transcriptional regulator [Phyllobacterium sp.]